MQGVGEPEQLVVQEVPEPEAGEGQAVVEVRAAGINFADVLIRRGMYPQMPELPAVLGSEIAGELDGERVMGFVRGEGGGYAERVAVDSRWLLPLPASASFAEGAAFPMAFLTSWIPLTELVRIAFGARVLITAAAGAVGTAAVQIVRALNGRPVAAVGSAEKLELPRSLGAVEAVTYEQIEELEQVDAVFDLVGGDVFAASLGLLKPMGTAIAVGYAGGMWQEVNPAWLVGRNIGVHGFYLGRLIGRDPDRVERAAKDVLGLWEAGAVRPDRRRRAPAGQRRRGSSADRIASIDRKGRAHPMTALVTGSAGGIGKAIVAKLRGEGFDVKELDLVSGFDVSDPEAWEHIGSVDLACLNAGVLTGSDDIAGLTDEQYRRAVGVNVDGVVYGVRRLDRVMPKGSTIIVTASLAGLVGIPDDPIYGLTKHAVVGFVRSVASQLAERGIRIQAVCPGWADTALTPPEFKQDLESRGFRLLTPEAVAEGVWAAYSSEGTGEAWIVQPGREPLLYEFKGVPGPR